MASIFDDEERVRKLNARKAALPSYLQMQSQGIENLGDIFNLESEAVTSFAEILKATGQSGKAGSSTAGNLKFAEEASKNKVKFFGQGFPIKDGFVNWYSDRTLSKNSKIIAEALTSDKGIQAFIDLTQDWKDYNRAFSLLRAVTVGAGEMN